MYPAVNRPIILVPAIVHRHIGTTSCSSASKTLQPCQAPHPSSPFQSLPSSLSILDLSPLLHTAQLSKLQITPNSPIEVFTRPNSRQCIAIRKCRKNTNSDYIVSVQSDSKDRAGRRVTQGTDSSEFSNRARTAMVI